MLLTTKILRDSIESGRVKKTAMVFFRQPKESHISLWQSHSEVKKESSNSSESARFVFAPFTQEKTPSLMLEESFCNCFQYDAYEKKSFDTSISLSEDARVKELHIQKVAHAVETINTTDLNKVIVSRKVSLANTFDLSNTFLQLLDKYPNAFVYLWYHPDSGIWMGASPEILLKSEGETFTTMSLAGTQAKASFVSWSAKEKEEQQMVTDYIINALSLYQPLEVSAVQTVSAGSVYHLQTAIKGILPSGHLTRLLTTLHPTPAVCGTPTPKALAYIQENEGYDRSYYTGYLGLISPQSDSKVYVNLRSMQWTEYLVSIYVGGGITQYSDPLSEWEETCHKAQTMLGALVSKD